jgi:SAM-dependent methyltransferase
MEKWNKMNISYTNELHEKYKARTITSAQVVLPIVFNKVRPKSVVDIGCGHGIWLSICQQLGATDVLGVDGAYIDPERLLIPRDCFQPMDLNRPERIVRRFDLAMSVEVGEHLRPESTDAFLALLTSLSDQILFSAAIPGQPGDAHINAHWPAFWIEEFGKRGFTALDFIRSRIWHDERIMLCYRQNLLFFVKNELYQSNGVLRDLPRANCLQLIDADTLQSLLGFRESLCRCARILCNILRHGGKP